MDNTTTQPTELTFNVYSTDASWLGIYSLKGLLELNNEMFNPLHKSFVPIINEGKVRAALLGDKSYGFCYGFFVSYRKVEIMTLQEQKDFTDMILSSLYKRLRTYFIRCRRFNDDLMQEAILYVYAKMKEVRGVNNIENTIKMKYFCMMTDIDRKNIADYDILDQDGYVISSKTSSKIIFNDFDVVADDGARLSYIETFSRETVSLEEYNESCIGQVNDIKMSEIIKDVLYDRFSERDVALYLDYVENFRNMRVTGGNGGVSGLAEKTGLSRSTIKNKMRDFREYVETKKEEIMERYEAVCYPTMDKISLINIIND